jgi:tRNA(adenine34) deaminase
MPAFNHQVATTRGILEAECSDLLKTFFSELRVRNKQEKEALAAQDEAIAAQESTRTAQDE